MSVGRLGLWGASCLLLSSSAAFAADADWLSPAIGEGYGVQVKEGRTSDDELRKIKEAGLSYVRFVIPWGEVEKGKGNFRWGYFDEFIGRLRKQGLKAVVVLGGGHPNYTGFMEAPADNIDKTDRYVLAPSTPEAIAGFARFAREAAKHFGSQGIIWEIWNEPDQNRFWAPKANVEDYIALASASCRAMKAENAGIKVVGPGQADMPGRWSQFGPGFMGRVMQSDAGACFDALSFHPYRDYEKPPETVLPAYESTRHFMKSHTPDGREPWPLLSTEWGFTTADVSEEEQAAFALRSFLLNSLSGVPLSIWYEWRDARPGADDPEAHFGLLKLNLKEKPAYRALAAFLPPLKGAVIEKRIDLNRKDVFALAAQKPNGNRYILYWTSNPKARVSLRLQNDEFPEGKSLPMTSMPQFIAIGTSPPKLSLTAMDLEP